jgi:hypothetical protein
MAITVDPALETKLRANAAAEGISVEQYLERLVKTDRKALTELESLALEASIPGTQSNQVRLLGREAP